MPLLRWPNGSTQLTAHGIDFLMMTHNGSSIRCRIMPGTLEELLGGLQSVREHQLVLFDKCRDKLESLASQKYDRSDLDGDMIIIGPVDVAKAGLSPAA